MGFDLKEHPYFTEWTDDKSGVRSYILTERVAPVQQSFYFTNPGVTPDEKWMWFYCAFPPNRGRMLGVVSLDPSAPEIRFFPQGGFTSASPMVAPQSDAVYFCMGPSVYRMNLAGRTQTICTLSEEFINGRNYNRLATHLSMSADGKYFLLDGDIGAGWWVGLGEIATGEVRILKQFGNHHNHAIFSPTEADLFVIPEDWWHDKISGRYFAYSHRVWLMTIDGSRYEPAQPNAGRTARTTGANREQSSRISHEWWSHDGMICWNDYDTGPFECDPHTLEATHVWKRPLCHVHCSSDRQLWCGDDSPYKWTRRPLELWFFDRRTGRETHIVSAMPQPSVPRKMYHLDPHPQFTPQDTWICYTTQVLGNVDVALTPVDQLV
ncbi:MAG: hypothetical protein J7M14_03355 [Planctomycetes bacterium]|nr:hypothetical protein [Planctomycetota bacterium]